MSKKGFCLKPDMYKDTNTKGGQIRDTKHVIDELKKHAQPNFMCNVEMFGSVVGQFSKEKKNWVIEMGFGNLLFLVDKKLPRKFTYWILTQVNPFRETLNLKNVDLPINSRHVHHILGIPNGASTLPKKPKVMEAEVKAFVKKYSNSCDENGSSNSGILNTVLRDAVEKVSDKSEFKQVFLMWTIGTILCPTTCPRLSPNFYYLVTLAEKAHKYNWCDLVLSYLFDCLKTFGEKFYQNGYSKGCGGCLYFLMIFYIDHLDRKPNQWGTVPRIRAWTFEEINKVSADDKIDTGDFGCHGCIQVNYTAPHPFQAVIPMEFVVMAPTISRLLSISPPRRQRRKATEKCPNDYKLDKQKRAGRTALAERDNETAELVQEDQEQNKRHYFLHSKRV